MSRALTLYWKFRRAGVRPDTAWRTAVLISKFQQFHNSSLPGI
jgi:hypothetical protein